MSLGQSVFILLCWALIGGAIGAMIGERKRRKEAGFWWGFFLGPLGWLIVALGPDMGPKCYVCSAPRVPGARLCHRCGNSPYPP